MVDAADSKSASVRSESSNLSRRTQVLVAEQVDAADLKSADLGFVSSNLTEDTGYYDSKN